MEEIDVGIGPVVHESILRFYMCCSFSTPPGGVLGANWTSGYFFNKSYA